jgi:hypothetical protein
MRTITNPICVNCYLKHARHWLRDFGVDKGRAERIIEKIKAKLPQETLNKHGCIICRKSKLSVCMYCAFLRTSKEIIKLSKGKQKEAYVDSANFELEEDLSEY